MSSKSQEFSHGVDNFLLFIDALNVGNVQRVELYWNYDGTIVHPGSTCGLFCNDHLYVSSVEISELNNYPESYDTFFNFQKFFWLFNCFLNRNRLAHTYKSCMIGAAYADMKDKSWAEFYPTACA